jgi:3',5'-cyclic AMP phosphodiesterase CpdA
MMTTATADHVLKILHISDLHARGPRERSRFALRRVLGEEWQQNLDAIRADGRIDVVCFTGDVADWGQPAEYEDATRFVSELLDRLEVGPAQFFVIPGNHDVNRAIAAESWAQLRKAPLSCSHHWLRLCMALWG